MFAFYVTYSQSKDHLKNGIVESGVRYVEVLASDPVEASLIAQQMVACRGVEPTACEPA